MKEHRIPTRMPSEDMFFTSAFHLPHPDLRWQIQVRRRDRDKAVALLAWEGLMKEAQGGDGHGTGPGISSFVRQGFHE